MALLLNPTKSTLALSVQATCVSECIHLLYEDLFEQANLLLSTSSMQQAQECCTALCERIQLLDSQTSEAVKLTGKKAQQVEESLLKANDEFNEANTELTNVRRALSKAKEKHARLNAQHKTSVRQLAEANEELAKAQSQARRRKKQKNRWGALNFIPDAVDNLNGTKAALRKKISRKRKAVNHYSGDLEKSRTEIAVQNAIASGLKSVKSTVKTKVNMLDKEIKKLGKQGTQLKNVNLALKAAKAKYPFLTDDVETIQDFLDCEDSGDTGLIVPHGSDSRALVEDFHAEITLLRGKLDLSALI